MSIDPRYLAGVPAMLMRGGTSKGLFFLADDLPKDSDKRDELLLNLMGSPDPRQIDGLGGAHPLTSKVAIISKAASTDAEADVDYLFLQVSVDQALVSDRQNCGNMVAAVGPFALERGLLSHPDATRPVLVRIRLLNTGGRAVARVPVKDGQVCYHGSTSISGVPNTAAVIQLDFDDTMGSSCGSLLPTGNITDEIDGVTVTMIDNGMPVVLLKAIDMGISGTETPNDLDLNDDLQARLESIRLQAGHLMKLGDVATTTIPKMTMLSPPSAGTEAALNTRTFIPHRCHDAIGVLGAVSVATAIKVPGTVAHRVAINTDKQDSTIIEHPTGTFEASVEVLIPEGQARSAERSGNQPSETVVNETVVNEIVVKRSGIVRTARKLMDGLAFPRSG